MKIRTKSSRPGAATAVPRWVRYEAQRAMVEAVHLGPWAELAHRRLADLVWSAQGRIPGGSAHLADYCRCPKARWPGVAQELRQAGWRLTAHRVSHPWADAVLDEAAQYTRMRSVLGSAGASARWSPPERELIVDSGGVDSPAGMKELIVYSSGVDGQTIDHQPSPLSTIASTAPSTAPNLPHPERAGIPTEMAEPSQPKCTSHSHADGLTMPVHMAEPSQPAERSDTHSEAAGVLETHLPPQPETVSEPHPDGSAMFPETPPPAPPECPSHFTPNGQLNSKNNTDSTNSTDIKNSTVPTFSGESLNV